MTTALEKSRTSLLHAAAELAARGAECALEPFLARYYRHTATEDLLARRPEDLLGAALSHRDLARERPVGRAKVVVFNPSVESTGWSTGHTVVQIVTDDMPFLVDSVTMAIQQRQRPIHLIVHPVMEVQRDVLGNLREVLDVVPDEQFGTVTESWMHLEIDRLSDPQELADLGLALHEVLSDVRDSVEDWPKMREHCEVLAASLSEEPPVGLDAAQVEQTTDFLAWLAADHFTFLGYRQYVLGRTPEGGDVLEPVAGSGLGLLRYDRRASDPASRLTPAAQERARDKVLLIITKANSRATVHRSAYLDYIGVKTFDADGEVTGEHRFLGLFAAAAYSESITGIPILRERAREVLERLGLPTDSHSGKDLLQVLESYPRDELFQTDVATLGDIATSVTHLQERIRTKLFLREDIYGRFVSALVYLPRDRYNTTVRLRIEGLLLAAFDGRSVDYTTRVTDSPLAQVHYVVHLGKDAPPRDVDSAALEREIVEATRTWDEDLVEAARAEYGEEGGARLAGLYGKGFPEAYKEDFHPRVAVADLRFIEALESDEDIELGLYHGPGSPWNERRFKLYCRGPLSLTRILPLFTHLGVEVTDERPYEIRRSDGVAINVYDLGLRTDDGASWGEGGDREAVRLRFQEAVAAVWRREAESDGFNALVLQAGLTWRQVVILRAVAKYLRQTQSTFSQDYVESALVDNTGIARLLVELFETRFDPQRYAGAAGPDRAAAAGALTSQLTEALDAVRSLDHDRILRALLAIVAACLRTNYYQAGPDGSPKPYVSLKLDPRSLPDLPAPRPMFEVWVYSPRVEGVHMRMGRVARGGLRWSDRREDFRTESLGLVMAQLVKNAVIVPTGAKGGFLPKTLPDPDVDREAWLAEGIDSYRWFISGMLDVTDNRVGTTIEPPENVVRHDGDDTYLVVAADKGTASFSDIANETSRSYGFWLDDAFASGGSDGYDHKSMGITARGAWESVKRHFRELGVDTQSTPFTVVGIGDMSGDVFGNGMLLSEHIRLVAAFDHRHVFIDPDPDPLTSYAERRRLFDLPRSSWEDYDTSLLSPGGGVFPRSAKSIALTPPMVQALGLPADRASMTPAELIRAILLAPVDLLWNGGIGTYVKASTESNAEVGDRANDAVRVDGCALRCRVVGEGGNLGLTQQGRIEAALIGVSLGTDALDNSAGVDTSDHEVNIKILLGLLTRAGDMTLKQRNALLAQMTSEVAADVLRDNYEQNVLLGNARIQAPVMLPVHQRLIQHLERHAELDRALECLPSDAEIVARHKDGLGLTSPELAVLVAHTKLHLKGELLATTLPDDPWFSETLVGYFPTPIREGFGDVVARHPLRREIVTNAVVNSMVNRGGISFAFRASEETGAPAEQVARAFVVSREVFDLAGFVAAVEELDNVVSTRTQSVLYLEFRRLLDRSVRWLLSRRAGPLDVAAEIARFEEPVRRFAPTVPGVLQGAARRRLERRTEQLLAAGVPEPLAVRTASLLDVFSLLDVVEIAADAGEAPEQVLQVHSHVSERLGIDNLLVRVAQLPREDRWDALARGALRDDLYAVLDQLTRAVLACSDPGREPADRVRDWAQRNAQALARADSGRRGIERLEPVTIAALSVALRSLRALVRAGA